jgi:hypothetical protein
VDWPVVGLCPAWGAAPEGQAGLLGDVGEKDGRGLEGFRRFAGAAAANQEQGRCQGQQGRGQGQTRRGQVKLERAG